METAKTVTVVFSGWPSDQLLWREGLSGQASAPLTPVRAGLCVRGVPVCTGGLARPALFAK